MEAFLFPVLLLAGFYFLVIRPSRNRQRAALQLQEQLAPGLEVMTTSGMYGRVAAVHDDSVSLDVAPGVTIRVVKAAVGKIVTDEAGEAGEADEADVASADEVDPVDSAAPASDDLSGDDRPSR